MNHYRIDPGAFRSATASGYFVGEASIQPLVSSEDGVDVIAVRFEAGARTYLHSHSVTQILHVIEGRGTLATEGDKQRYDVGPGDVIHVLPGEMHWHGAADDSHMVHISIRPPGDQGKWTKIDPRG
jgi:quercetin dioxygenase-like cupin family protein